MESLPDRMAATKEILKGFTASSGIEVELVGIDEAQAPQLLMSAALSDGLPDVMMSFPLALVQQMHAMEMVDSRTAGAVIDALGVDTFEPAALDLVTAQDVRLAVPSDGWSQILVYRRDLFEKAGLAPPDTYETLQAAAEALTSDEMFGITLATDPSDVFTQQSFEAVALGNGCRLVDERGKVLIAEPACLPAFELYATLGGKLSPAGTQTVDTTRATYFNGQAAMVMWSTYILDEMAGLREDALPALPETQKDPGFLARNSGILTTISGPDGTGKGAFGEIASFVPMDTGKGESVQALIEHLMGPGYVDWLAMAPEGKTPMRRGTRQSRDEFLSAWSGLEIGVDRKAPLSDFYDPQTIQILGSVGRTIDRWAIPEGQGALLGAFSAQLPLASAVAEMTGGSISPREAAQHVARDAEEMSGS